MAIGIRRRRLEIRVLDDSDKRKARIIDVEPIGIRQAVLQLQHEARVGQILDGAYLRQVVRRHMRLQQIGNDRQRRRCDHHVGFDDASGASNANHPAVPDDQLLHGFIQPDRCPLRSDLFGPVLDQCGKAAAIICQVLAARFLTALAALDELVPQPDGPDLVPILAEFADQQRLPDDLVNLPPAGSQRPLLDREIRSPNRILLTKVSGLNRRMSSGLESR